MCKAITPLAYCAAQQAWQKHTKSPSAAPASPAWRRKHMGCILALQRRPEQYPFSRPCHRHAIMPPLTPPLTPSPAPAPRRGRRCVSTRAISGTAPCRPRKGGGGEGGGGEGDGGERVRENVCVSWHGAGGRRAHTARGGRRELVSSIAPMR